MNSSKPDQLKERYSTPIETKVFKSIVELVKKYSETDYYPDRKYFDAITDFVISNKDKIKDSVVAAYEDSFSIVSGNTKPYAILHSAIIRHFNRNWDSYFNPSRPKAEPWKPGARENRFTKFINKVARIGEEGGDGAPANNIGSGNIAHNEVPYGAFNRRQKMLRRKQARL